MKLVVPVLVDAYSDSPSWDGRTKYQVMFKESKVPYCMSSISHLPNSSIPDEPSYSAVWLMIRPNPRPIPFDEFIGIRINAEWRIQEMSPCWIPTWRFPTVQAYRYRSAIWLGRHTCIWYSRICQVSRERGLTVELQSIRQYSYYILHTT